MRYLYVVVLVVLTGCPATTPPKDGDRPMPTPAGFDAYCARHPERLECGGTQ